MSVRTFISPEYLECETNEKRLWLIKTIVNVNIIEKSEQQVCYLLILCVEENNLHPAYRSYVLVG